MNTSCHKISRKYPEIDLNEHKLQTISRKYPEIDVNEHELQKFVLIFQKVVMLTYLDETFPDSVDGISSLLVGLAKQIQNLLNKDIGSLKFPAVIKKALKVLKALLNLFTTAKKSAETTSKINKIEKITMGRTKRTISKSKLMNTKP